MNGARRVLLAISLLLSAVLIWHPALAQLEGQRYFPETGHWVTGEFLNTYESVSDPVRLYGYPLTEAYQDQFAGRWIQYFQRARFELHPEAPPELRVQLTPLGEYLYTGAQPLPAPDSSAACRSYPETGFKICYAFLEFFDKYGGVAQFGYPKSNFVIENERIVQYFQRARFEWHPELPAGERVTLGDLGMEYFQEINENPLHLAPVLDDNMPQTILGLKVRAFPQNAVMPPAGTQTIFVVVRDQNLQPVANAQVTLLVMNPSGKVDEYALPSTNANGIAQLQFSYEESSTGVVQVWAVARYENLHQETVTSFRLWW